MNIPHEFREGEISGKSVQISLNISIPGSQGTRHISWFLSEILFRQPKMDIINLKTGSYIVPRVCSFRLSS